MLTFGLHKNVNIDFINRNFFSQLNGRNGIKPP